MARGGREFQPLGRFAGHDLTLSCQQLPHGPYELSHDDERVGIVDRGSSSVRAHAGGWEVQVKRRLLGWRLNFDPFRQQHPSALYTPRTLRPGGRLALSDGTTYTFRLQRPFSQAWALVDAQGRVLARLAPERVEYMPGKWVVGLGAAVSDEPGATLAVLAACFALLTHQAQSASSA